MTFQAFFYTAQDARRALNALQAAGVEASEPEPLQRPEDGRQWSLTIEVVSGSSTTRHPSPVLMDKAFEVVLECNGITNRS